MGDRDEVATVPDPETRSARPLQLALSERYSIGARIGKGGMGEVLVARDEVIGRDVAIKRMLAVTTPRTVARFMREARVQGRLEHPAIVPVHEMGLDENARPYFVMKRIAGRTLRECLTDTHRMHLVRAFVDVLHAIEYAHSRGVIHRDLKPENIIVGDFGEVYVLDWGVAKILGESDVATDADTGEHLATRAGTVIGTPEYMAPEQAAGVSDIDGRADVFALGKILEEILGTEKPIELEALCKAALVEDRAKRLPAVKALADGVQVYLDGDRDLARRRELAATHVVNAQAALARSAIENRALAMREAGRAIALDPTSIPAAELVGQLLLSPPPQVPDVVQRELVAEQTSMLRNNTIAGMPAIASFVLFGAAILLTTRVPTAPMMFMIGLALGALCLLGLFRQLRHLHLVSAIAGLAVLGFIVILARLYPPFLIAPVIAALTAATGPFMFQYYRARAVIAATAVMLLATLLPYLGELAGWLEPTFTLVPDGVLLHTPALQGSATAQLAILPLYVTAVICFGGFMGYIAQQSELGSRRQVRVQAWHLRQLVNR